MRPASGLRVSQAFFTPRHELKNRLSGTLVLEARAESYLHVWSGRMHVELDLSGIRPSMSRAELVRAIERRAEGLARRAIVEPAELASYGEQLVMPGSSLKGAVRARLELLGKEAGVCFAIQDRPDYRPAKGQHGWRHYALWRDAAEPPRRQACGDCITCDLFGSPGKCSRIFFGNLKLRRALKNPVEELQLDYGERVRAIKPGTLFEGEISFLGLQPEELGLLAFGMRLHEGKPILIGKSKYRRRVRQDTGEEVTFGRLLLRAVELRLAPWCRRLAEELAQEASVSFTLAQEGGGQEEVVFSGESLAGLLRHLVEKAKQAYEGFNYDFDELSCLEAIWREERDQGA